MFKRLKKSMIESYVGAIALGWLLAQSILHFANVFSAPVAHWIMRNEYRGILDRGTVSSSLSLQDAAPDLIRALSLLLLWYLLFRWLYLTPPNKESSEPAPSAD